jgi:hypothetical protein
MTFLFFKVARDVGDINKKDCLFNNESNGFVVFIRFRHYKCKEKYEIKNIVEVSWVP